MMNRGMAFVLVGLGVAGLLVTYILVTGFDAPAAVESGLQSVREMVATPPAAEEDSEEAEEPAEAETAAPRPTPPPAAPLPAPTAVTVPTPAAPPPAPVPPADDPVEPTGPPASAPSGRAPLNRSAHFLPGNYATWTEFDVEVSTPIVLRAGGVVSSAPAVAGPAGVAKPTADANAQPINPAVNRLVLPGAPYLSLIGRICSEASCSAPFLVGTDATLCPSDLGMTGQLQLLTNNYVRMGGRQTASNYSTTTGGYSFYTEPAADSACTAGATAAPVRQDSAALAAGEVLRKPEFSLSSGLTFWKPFFVPMSAPFVVRASGQIAATSGRPAAGPAGVNIPEDRRWWTPTAEANTNRRRGQLFIESMPYHALIGRLCGSAGCGQPFVVGAERVVCPTPGYGDRIELWINRVIAAPGMLDNQTPMTFEMFDVQTQRGGFEFEVAPADAGACGG